MFGFAELVEHRGHARLARLQRERDRGEHTLSGLEAHSRPGGEPGADEAADRVVIIGRGPSAASPEPASADHTQRPDAAVPPLDVNPPPASR